MPSHKILKTKQRSDQKTAFSATTLLKNHSKRRYQLQTVQAALQKSATETKESDFIPLILD